MLFVITFMTAGVGGSTKKIAFGAAYQLGYTIGNIIGPQTYRESDAPDYYVSVQPSGLKDERLTAWQTAKYTMLAFLVFCIFIIASIGSLHWWWNRRRDQQDELDRRSKYTTILFSSRKFANLAMKTVSFTRLWRMRSSRT